MNLWPTLFLLTYCLLIGAVRAQEQFPITLPDGCHAQLRSGFVNTVPAPIEAFNRAAHLQSYDILCVGKIITITEPLRSSGGQVIILAEKLRLSASIDTRPYFRKVSVRPFAGKEAFPASYASNFPQYEISAGDQAWLRAREAVVEDVFPFDPHMQSIVLDYYAMCSDCVRVGGEVWMPELPSGISPPFLNWPLFQLGGEIKDPVRNGIPPYSEIDRDLASSGDIFLYVEEVEIAAPGETASVRAPDPLSCSSDQSFRLALLEVAGARGGRGGLGQPNTCMGDPINRNGYSGYSCVSGPGGKNSVGGSGGTAGNVYLYEIGDGSLSLGPYVDTTGGPGAGSATFQMPRDWTPPAVICGYKIGDELSAAPDGTGGQYSRRNLTLAEAWAAVQISAAALDGLYQHDLLELGRRAEIDPRVVALSFSDHLNLSARAMETAALRAFLERLRSEISRRYDGTLSHRAADFWGWSGPSPGSELVEPLASSLGHLHALSVGSVTAQFADYLTRSGGLLGAGRGSDQLEINLRRIREVLTQQLDVSSRIRLALERINVGIVSINYGDKLERARNEIASVVEAIRSKLAAYEADKASYDKEWKEAGGLFTDGFLSLLTGGLNAGLGLADGPAFDPTPPLGKIAKGLIRMAGIGDLNTPTLAGLNAELFAARASLAAISREAAIEQEVADAVRASALSEAIETRRNGTIELANRAAAVPDLLISAWLTFIASTDRSPARFIANLSSLVEFAAGEEVPSEIVLSETPSLGRCSGVQGRPSTGQAWFSVDECLVVLPSDSRRVVTGVVDSEPALADLRVPLLVLAPFTIGEKRFNLQGFSSIEVVLEGN